MAMTAISNRGAVCSAVRRLVAALFLTALCWISPAATIYDAAGDFTLAANPNGVWAYGRNSGPGGAFVAFTESSANPTSFNYWLDEPFSAGYPNYYPHVAKNVTGSTFTNATGLSVPTDVLYMAPGIGLLSIVQFTAMNAGQHSFSGEFLGLQQPFDRGGGFGSAPGPTALVSATLNGTSALIAATALNAPAGSPGGNVAINFVLNLNAGDVIHFAVDSTQFFTQQSGRPDLDIQGDSIGLRLTVTAPDAGELNPIPEPSSMVLVALALGALALHRRHRSLRS